MDNIKQKIVNGITVVSNPVVSSGAIIIMVLLGFLKTEDLSTIFLMIMLAYLCLSIIGGFIIKSDKNIET